MIQAYQDGFLTSLKTMAAVAGFVTPAVILLIVIGLVVYVVVPKPYGK